MVHYSDSRAGEYYDPKRDHVEVVSAATILACGGVVVGKEEEFGGASTGAREEDVSEGEKEEEVYSDACTGLVSSNLAPLCFATYRAGDRIQACINRIPDCRLAPALFSAVSALPPRPSPSGLFCRPPRRHGR